jgi:hypothetical protein
MILGHIYAAHPPPAHEPQNRCLEFQYVARFEVHGRNARQNAGEVLPRRLLMKWQCRDDPVLEFL